MAKSVYEMSDEEIMELPLSDEDETENTNEPNDPNSDEELTEDNSSNGIEYTSSDEEFESEDNSENNSDNEEIDESSIYDNNDNSEDNSDTIPNNTNKEVPNYKEFYEKVLAPFKANGSTIQLKSADEVISLMQMGMDYTRKTQDISRYKKPLLMLERANLLNEDHISFFIDLMSGNQEAVRKLLKDHNIDAFSLPSDDEEINYNAGTHKVTDEQVALTEVFNEVASKENGTAFLMELRGWDEWTKEQIYAAPDIVKSLFYQKQVGVFDQVVTEVNRLKSIGYIPFDAPFIKAYNYVAGQMVKAKNQNMGSPSTSRRTAITSNRFSNSHRARSAGITRTSPRTTDKYVNPLSMSDEEFTKRFGS